MGLRCRAVLLTVFVQRETLHSCGGLLCSLREYLQSRFGGDEGVLAPIVMRDRQERGSGYHVS
ncbi:hypothetical protein BKA93DRAFT_800745 [Sparassis latifolia]